jgi:hypothetical protein
MNPNQATLFKGIIINELRQSQNAPRLLNAKRSNASFQKGLECLSEGRGKEQRAQTAVGRWSMGKLKINEDRDRKVSATQSSSVRLGCPLASSPLPRPVYCLRSTQSLDAAWGCRFELRVTREQA